MITLEELYKNIERLKTPYIRIYDYSGNLIHSIEDKTSAPATIRELQEVMPAYAAYNKVTIKAADDNKFKSNYTGCYKWDVLLQEGGRNKTGAVVQQQQTFGGMPEWMFRYLLESKNNNQNVPAGYVPQAVVDAQNQNVLLQIAHLKELHQLKSNQNDPMKFLPFLPLAYDLLGKDSSKVMSAMGKISGLATVKSPTNTLTFEDVAKLSDEEKNKKISELVNKLAQKEEIAAEEMIAILSALDNNRDLVLVAKLAEVIPTDVLNKLINGLIAQPQYAPMAVAFLESKK